MAKLFANSGDPDQKPCSATSDLGLHYLPITFYRSPYCNGLITELFLVKDKAPDKTVLRVLDTHCNYHTEAILMSTQTHFGAKITTIIIKITTQSGAILSNS